MTDLGDSGATLLVITNVARGGFVAGAVLAVTVAAVMDAMARRRMRGTMPDAWPPVSSKGK